MQSRNTTTTAEDNYIDDRIMCFKPMDGTIITNSQYGKYWETHRGYCQRVVDDWKGNNSCWLFTPHFIRKDKTVVCCIGFLYSIYQSEYLYCLTFDNNKEHNYWISIDEDTPYPWIKAVTKMFLYHIRPAECTLFYTPSYVLFIL